MKQLIWIPLLAAVAVGLAGCSRGGEKLATINGETITLEQFHKYLETKGSVRVRTANGQVGAAEVAESLGFQALQDMIQQKLVLQMAKDEGVYPTDKDLEAEVEFQKKRNPNFLKVLTSQGLSIDDIRARLRVDLAREKLITRGLNVKTEEAEKYIADNPKEFVDPATADSLVIFVSKEAKRKEVDAELARGMEFKIVATRYSEIPGA
ncbi:MAG: SurA N-terminal domain-containing protein, partial [Chthonomonas sp.]|nr:SurA N-terminal domain-containing protein [Chthonomonas sp.]